MNSAGNVGCRIRLQTKETGCFRYDGADPGVFVPEENMLKNFLKIAFRNLLKNRRYALINILGLAIGLACVVLIMLWVQDELSFDRFHENSGRIYMAVRSELGGISAATSMQLGPALVSEVPEVINATAYVSLPETYSCFLQVEDRGFSENLGLIDPQFFEVFSFKLAAGDPQSLLQDPHSILLTERMARKYFGETDALGQSLRFTVLGRNGTLKVTGILEDIPRNSHIQREIFISRAYVVELLKHFGISNWDHWVNRSARTYILTQGGVKPSELASKLAECERNHLPKQHLETLGYSLIPLEKIHLHASRIEDVAAQGDIKYVYIFSAIATVILLIASMNYMNLSNALSLRRTREIGIQKVAGARRNSLIMQYMCETAVLTTLAMGVALVLVELALPFMNQLSRKALAVDYQDPAFLLMIISVTVFTSLVSGIYPAFFISAFQPVQVLKGKFQADIKSAGLRKGLIIFQFSLSITIITCTVVVLRQLDFMTNSRLGFDKENIVCLKIKGDISSRYDGFKQQLLNNPDILSLCRSEPMDRRSIGSTEGIDWPGHVGKFSIKMLHTDCDFAATYKIGMHAGRFFSEAFPSDKTTAYVLNQAAVAAMGIDSPIGHELTVWYRKGRIIGVARDFHYDSFHHRIEPLIFRIPDPEEQNALFREISVRIRPYSMNESLVFLKSQWESFFPDQPFDFTFFDESLNTIYQSEQQMGTIFRYFSFLAIFIACLGLYGLTALTIEQKVKDIGIHKVLGAGVSHIVRLLSMRYMWWIVFSNCIAWPVTWLAMSRWLQNFAYRVDITIWPFLLAGFSTLAVALMTVSWQTIRAATANPVKSLRYE